jgi:hypothetical protein
LLTAGSDEILVSHVALLVEHERRKFEESNVELELGKEHAQSDKQSWMIYFLNLQNTVSEIGPNTDVAAVENPDFELQCHNTRFYIFEQYGKAHKSIPCLGRMFATSWQSRR